MRDAFLTAAAGVQPLLADGTLARRWNEPSALAEMTNGALAAHLARAGLIVGPYLDGTPPESGTELVSASDYFVVLKLSARLDDPLNRGVRERAEQGAAGGPEALIKTFDAALQALKARLATEPADRAMRVAGDIPILLDDYLVTRMIELVVHGDDLAVSIGVAPPAFPAAATDAAITSLIGIARERHGDLAVIRALARRERDPVEALRVI